MATLEEQKKLLVPFLQRAQEIERAEPKVAYYCRMYALEQGLEIPKATRAPEITGLLEVLMGKLEKDRAAVTLGGREEDQAHCESFALAVFNRADRVDRAGRADKATAVTFYAASYFFEVLRHFGEPPADIQQKQRYAAWRAAEINKAVKEGRPPAPPPSATSAEMDEEAAMLEELAKLETGGSSSSGSLPAAPSGLAGAAGAGTSAAAVPPPPLPPAAPLPPPPPAAAASTRLSGLPPALDEDSDWAPPGQPAPGSAPPPPAMPPPPPFDAAAGAPPTGSSEAGDGHHFELPSPPKQRPIETQHSHGAWVPPPPRRFQTFQKVLFRPDGAPAPVRGTVAKVEEGAHPEQPTYLVALPDRIAAVTDPTQLAPELATGEAVRYHGPSGQSVDATVAELDLSHWPPSYLVRLADGNYVDTTDDRLVQLNVPKPKSEGADLSHFGLAGSGTAAAGGAGGAYPPAPPAAPAVPPPAPAPAARPAAPPAIPAAPAAAPAAAVPAGVKLPQPVAGYQPGLREITEASKLTKSATSALQFEDVNTAVRLLTEALGLLTQPQRK